MPDSRNHSPICAHSAGFAPQPSTNVSPQWPQPDESSNPTMATISPAEAAHFRFPNTLQGSGSGSGKSIKILAQRSIKNRGDAHLVVIGVLAVLNFMMSPRYIWVGWVALGWGSGVLIHGLRAFDKVPFLTADWEKRQAEKYLGRNL